MRKHDQEYDVALSFAGEDRGYVAKVASILRGKGIKVFYDKYEEVELWGKDLYTHLDEIYRLKSQYCVMFISANYKSKLWTNHERESAQARAFDENREYILPARFDDTEIPGIKPTVGYIDLRGLSPEQFASLVLEKIGTSYSSTEKIETGEKFRIPKLKGKSFNPYEEALRFVTFLAAELKRRCDTISETGVSITTFKNGSKNCFRVVYNGKLIYSLNVWLDESGGTPTINFYGLHGASSGPDQNAINAYAMIWWDKEIGEGMLELHNLSLLPKITEHIFNFNAFVDALWDKICSLLEAEDI